MGLSLEFLAGERDVLIAAFKDFDLDTLFEKPACLYRADFSLHLAPDDLDLMTQSIGEASGVQPLDLLPFLSEINQTEDNCAGILSVENTWRDYIADSSGADEVQIAKRWWEKMADKYSPENIELTDAVPKAIHALLDL